MSALVCGLVGILLGVPIGYVLAERARQRMWARHDAKRERLKTMGGAP